MSVSVLENADETGAMPTALSGHVTDAQIMPTPSLGHGAERFADSENVNFRWLLFLAAAMLIALAGPALIGHVYTADDLGAFHLPIRAFYADCLKRGAAFDWSPQLYGGFYLTGEGQIGGYHPLHWLLYRWLPLPVAFDLECLVGYPFMLAGMYLFLRRSSLRRDAAMFGAISFAFSGFCLLHFVHVNAIEVVAHIPWLLWAIDGLCRSLLPDGTFSCSRIYKNSGSRRIAGIFTNSATAAGPIFALLIASQWLLGYPQYVLYSAIAVIGYAALLIHGDAAKPQAMPAIKRWVQLGLWATLGTLIGAVQILPTFEALQESTRQNVSGDFTNWGSLAPLNLIQLIAPYLFKTRVVGQNTHELGLYIGAVPLLLAIGCFLGKKLSASERRLRIFAASLAIVGLLIAFGEFGPLGRLLPHIPLLRDFRFPCRAIVLVHFGAAILAAIGFQCLVRRDRVICGAAAKTTFSAIGLASYALAVLAPLAWPEYVATMGWRWIGPAILLSAVACIWLAANRIRMAVLALGLLTAIDLGKYGLSYAVYPQHESLNVFVDDMMPTHEQRRWALDLAVPNQHGARVGNEMLLAGDRRIDGYAGLEPTRRLNYRDVAALRAGSVDEFSGTAPIDQSQLENCGYHLRPLPYVRLVANAVASDDPAREINYAPIETAALVAEPVGQLWGPIGKAAVLNNNGPISAIPSDIHVAISVSGRQLLVLAESFHPGWRALADGKPITIVRTNGDFMGCVVEPGVKEVDFRYAPASLHYGRLASVLGLSLLVGTVVMSRMRRRTVNHNSSPGPAVAG